MPLNSLALGLGEVALRISASAVTTGAVHKLVDNRPFAMLGTYSQRSERVVTPSGADNRGRPAAYKDYGQCEQQSTLRN